MLFRRIGELEPNLRESLIEYNGRDVAIAVDASGLKVTNRGEWMREMMKIRGMKEEQRKRMGWIKINVSVDVKTIQVVSLKITDEKVADTKVFTELVGEAKNNVESKGGRLIRVCADKGYDSNKNFNFVEKLGITPAINIRAPWKISFRSKNPRKKYGRIMVELGYDVWREMFGYGDRLMVETFFSKFKREYGECVRARKKENIIQEVMLRCVVYNLIVRYELTGKLPWDKEGIRAFGCLRSFP